MHKPKFPGVLRFPRLGGGDTLKERAVLEQSAFALLTHPLEWRIELGRIFIGIKATLPHRQWESYFAETFTGPFDITLRTAQNYMNLAREANGTSKNENGSLSTSASDDNAVKTKEANAKAEVEVGDSRIVNLPLLLTPNERKAVSNLLKSSRWREARREITTFVNELCVKFKGVEREHDEAAAD